MPTKKKKGAKRKHNPSPAKKKAKSHHKRRRNPSAPAGMVMVPASMVGPVATAAKKKRKGGHRRRHPQRHNPDGEHSRFGNALAAVGFGALAALFGIGGGYALSKLNIKSRAGNIAANAGLGVVTGGLVGAFNPAAGTMLAHNYIVSAGQWLMSPTRTTPRAPPMEEMAMIRRGVGGASPRMMAARRASLNGPGDVEGVAADTMGDAYDVSGMEHLQGVAADTMGDAYDVSGMEPLQGVAADTMGDAYDMSALDDMGDDLFGPDEMQGIDDVGDVGDPFGDVEVY